MTDQEERAKDILRRLMREVLNFAERITMIAQEADQKKIPDIPKETVIKMIEEFMDEVKKKVEAGEILKGSSEIFGVMALGFLHGALKKKDEKIEVA